MITRDYLRCLPFQTSPAKKKTVSSVLSVKLSCRNSMRTLSHVALSLPRYNPKPSPSIDISLRHNLTFPSNKKNSLISTTSPIPTVIPSPHQVNARVDAFPMELLRTHPPRIRPRTPPPWLLPPVPPDSNPLPAMQHFLLSVPWIVPPWLSVIFSVPPPGLLPPVPPDPAASHFKFFLRLHPWMIPPWIPW